MPSMRFNQSRECLAMNSDINDSALRRVIEALPALAWKRFGLAPWME